MTAPAPNLMFIYNAHFLEFTSNTVDLESKNSFNPSVMFLFFFGLPYNSSNIEIFVRVGFPALLFREKNIFFNVMATVRGSTKTCLFGSVFASILLSTWNSYNKIDSVNFYNRTKLVRMTSKSRCCSLENVLRLVRILC
jgi:hypothetical protein